MIHFLPAIRHAYKKGFEKMATDKEILNAAAKNAAYIVKLEKQIDDLKIEQKYNWAAIEDRNEEIKKYKKRLEIDPKFADYDGIKCRDITISNLDKKIEGLTIKNDAYKAIRFLEESRGELYSAEEFEHKFNHFLKYGSVGSA